MCTPCRPLTASLRDQNPCDRLSGPSGGLAASLSAFGRLPSRWTIERILALHGGMHRAVWRPEKPARRARCAAPSGALLALGGSDLEREGAVDPLPDATGVPLTQRWYGGPGWVAAPSCGGRRVGFGERSRARPGSARWQAARCPVEWNPGASHQYPAPQTTLRVDGNSIGPA